MCVPQKITLVYPRHDVPIIVSLSIARPYLGMLGAGSVEWVIITIERLQIVRFQLVVAHITSHYIDVCQISIK